MRRRAAIELVEREIGNLQLMHENAHLRAELARKTHLVEQERRLTREKVMRAVEARDDARDELACALVTIQMLHLALASAHAETERARQVAADMLLPGIDGTGGDT